MRTARVLVVHPHRIAAEAMSRRLNAEPGIRTVEIAGTTASAHRAIESLGPDVVVIRVEADDRQATDLTARLAAREPPIRVVALIGDDDPASVMRAIRAGAIAVVAKDSRASELVDAVRAAATGNAWVSHSLLGAVIRELRSSVPPPNQYDKKLERLTMREREVLDRLVAGHDRSTIARDLVVSIGTVRTHTRNILAKLEVHSSLEAVSVARRGNHHGPRVRKH